MPTSLQGKIAVVTGSSRGLGRRVAERLAAQGARVALVARSAGALQEVAAAIHKAGGQALAIISDTTTPGAIDALVQQVHRRLGQPSILINAAGIFGPIQ